MSKIPTRSSPQGLVAPGELPTSSLPTNKDVLAKILLERSAKNTQNIEACLEPTFCEIKNIYARVNSRLPVIGDKQINRNLKSLYSEYREQIRCKYKGEKRNNFIRKLEKLFDIVKCKCKKVTCNVAGCEGCSDTHIDCNCPESSKIPKNEVEFILSERDKHLFGVSKFFIGNRDKETEQTMESELSVAERRAIRAERQEYLVQLEKERVRREQEEKVMDESRGDEEFSTADLELEEVYVDAQEEEDNEEAPACEREDDSLVADNRKTKEERNMTKLNNLARECVRWGVSPRAGAAIANGVLADHNIISKENTKEVIDKNKLKRAIGQYKLKVRENHEQMISEKKPEMFVFDGRQDSTLVMETDDQGKNRVGLIKEEHLTIISEPGSLYATHVTCGKKGRDVAYALYDYLNEREVVKNVKILGADSTAVNTGINQGAITIFEKLKGERVVWSICLLHLNELPLRHIVEEVDGATDSSNTFKGPLGKMLPDVDKFELKMTFRAVGAAEDAFEVADKVIDDLSTDQKMLLLACQSVIAGRLKIELLSLKPGPICHSRWLTLAIRFLLLWMSKHELSGKNLSNLKNIVHFIVVSYAPQWFKIKQEGNLGTASIHLFNQIRILKKLKAPILGIAKTNVARNSYFAHSELLLLTMLADQDEEVRAEAVNKIVDIRKGENFGDKSPRKFKVPRVLFDCKKYTEMIDWEKEEIMEPRLTSDISTDMLRDFVERPMVLSDFPSHSQGCERAVKETTKASISVVGFESRDGHIKTTLVSRQNMSQFVSKKDFSDNFE